MFAFTDVNECDRKLHECDQICINNIGSYRCQCKAGYYLHDNKKTCKGMSVYHDYYSSSFATVDATIIIPGATTG